MPLIRLIVFFLLCATQVATIAECDKLVILMGGDKHNSYVIDEYKSKLLSIAENERVLSEKDAKDIALKWASINKPGVNRVLDINFNEASFMHAEKSKTLGRFIVTLMPSNGEAGTIESIVVLMNGSVLSARSVSEDEQVQMLECM